MSPIPCSVLNTLTHIHMYTYTQYTHTHTQKDTQARTHAHPCSMPAPLGGTAGGQGGRELVQSRSSRTTSTHSPEALVIGALSPGAAGAQPEQLRSINQVKEGAREPPTTPSQDLEPSGPAGWDPGHTAPTSRGDDLPDWHQAEEQVARTSSSKPGVAFPAYPQNTHSQVLFPR